jgi:ubiquinol-cytochrome c reductase cytochrome c subunit
VNSSPSRAARARSKVSGYAVLLLALATLGAVYTGLASSSSAQESSAQPASAQSLAIKEGRELYLTGCSTCHGLNLAGGAGGPSLIGTGAAAVVFQVESGRMPLSAGVQQAPRKAVKYTTAEIDQMAAYIQANGGGPTIPDGDLRDGDLAVGKELFATNCASCHNFAGSGGALTYGKYAPELDKANARVIYSAMQTGPESMPRYSDESITPEEKRAIVRYVEYITAAEDQGGASLGRLGPISEGLVAWLVGITVMVGMTLWIGARA